MNLSPDQRAAFRNGLYTWIARERIDRREAAKRLNLKMKTLSDYCKGFSVPSPEQWEAMQEVMKAVDVPTGV